MVHPIYLGIYSNCWEWGNFLMETKKVSSMLAPYIMRMLAL
jgi:hypothetical protein